MNGHKSEPIEGDDRTAASCPVEEWSRLEKAVRTQSPLLESMFEGVSLLNEQGIILYTNPAKDRMFGYGPGELIGQHIAVLSTGSAEESARIVESVIAVLKAGGHWSGEWPSRRKDGTEFVTSARISRVELDGRTHWLSVHHDITERKRAEAELRSLAETLERRVEERTRQLMESEARYRAYFDNFPDSLFILEVTPDGRFLIIDKNPAAERATGRPLRDTLGQSPLDFLAGESGAKAGEMYRRCLETRRPVSYMDHMTFPAGEATYDIQLVPLADKDGRVTRILGAARDVTQRNLLEAQFAQMQKMEAIGRMTGGIAHDFNNLLTVIVGNLDLIDRSAGDPARVRELVASTMAAAARGEQLNRQLLTYARRQPLRPELVDANCLIRGLNDLIRRAVGESITVELALDEAPTPCEVDPSQFESALLNLAVNARDAMPAGGRLMIETANVTINEEQPQLATMTGPGDHVRIRVRDTGSGIAPEILPRVFDPFYTTKEVGKGSGLGLGQVYGFVTQSGGQVRIDSVVGQGTILTIHLPKAVPVTQKAEQQPHTGAERPTATTLRILVVEDDPDVRTIAEATLLAQGHTVVSAQDGARALEILRGSADLDLIFTDVVMPGGINGVQLAIQARQLRPDIGVLLTSGYTGTALKDYGATEERFPLLRKPYRSTELAEWLEAVQAARPRSAGVPTSLKVLVVEDDALVRMSAVAQIEALGHCVAEAASGEEALELLENAGGIDVLFTDFGLPGMNGQELIQAARRHDPTLGVVIATGRSAEQVASDLERVVYLGKPYHRERIQQALNEAMRGG